MKHERQLLNMTGSRLSGSEAGVPDSKEPTAEAPSTSIESVAPELPGDEAWDPTRAARLSALHAPVARGIAAVAAADPSDGPAFRVLVVGGVPGAVASILDGSPWGVRASAHFEVRDAVGLGDVRAAEDGAFDCVAAVDALSEIPPSRREQAVRELCRLARAGVVILSPFDTPEATAAARAVNALHRAAKGTDHPGLGRGIELGLPDMSVVRSWLESSFPHLVAEPAEAVESWRLEESLAAVGPAGESAPTAADIAAAAFFRGAGTARPGEAPFRTAVVASTRPVTLPSAVGGGPESALAAHLALRAAWQQRAFDRLTEAVTTERERERVEFHEAVASLAAELRDREAAAEALARQVRRLEHENADMRIALAEAEQSAYDIGVQDTKSQVHIRNLTAIIDERTAALAEAERQILATEEARARAERDRARSEAALAHAEEARKRAEAAKAHAETIHEQFISGRAGRAVTRYIDLKRRILRRG
jgi:hypothetical protein